MDAEPESAARTLLGLCPSRPASREGRPRPCQPPVSAPRPGRSSSSAPAPERQPESAKPIAFGEFRGAAVREEAGGTEGRDGGPARPPRPCAPSPAPRTNLCIRNCCTGIHAPERSRPS
ncbi:Hypothetical predicted protein [Podarcis lilfordi]|uniref:Uncharacterized protein n=1 Tax=Podarcis lilfordi TaxID=74358 RepID=A0AA35PBX1_9SAUR|nr:Hypothetical predicted protein [Podarcis lilfordi]